MLMMPYVSVAFVHYQQRPLAWLTLAAVCWLTRRLRRVR
jgi:hypothetical protein